jgi:hypothetical protein
VRFALDVDRPLFAFANMWVTFNGEGGSKSKHPPSPHITERGSRFDPSPPPSRSAMPGCAHGGMNEGLAMPGDGLRIVMRGADKRRWRRSGA